MAEFGRIDVVVNNAGGTMPRPFMDTSAGYFERAFHFNVTTAFVLSKAATPHMLAAGSGAIVNISSAIGRLRDRGFVAYGTAKAALTHMTRLMAADLAPKIRVNAIAVGSVATSALEIVLDNQEIHDEMVRRTPVKRLGAARGHRVLRALPRAPAGSFVTGKLFEIDGGLEEANLEMGLPDLLELLELVEFFGDLEAVFASAPGDDGLHRVEGDGSVDVGELAGEGVGRRLPQQLAREVGGLDAEQHEIGNVSVEPVAHVRDLHRRGAVDESFGVETRRPVLPCRLRRGPLGRSRDVQDQA